MTNEEDEVMCSECDWTVRQVADAGQLCGCGKNPAEHDYQGHTCYYVDDDGNAEATGDECYECLQEHRRRRYGDCQTGHAVSRYCS